MSVWSRLGLLVTAIGAAIVVTGAGQHHPATPGPENTAAAHAVSVLIGIHDDDPAAAMPADFADVMGYEPAIVDGAGGATRLEKVGGDGCSSPLGATTFDFGSACAAHDLGYDLLRYATVQGGELGPWARRAIDARFATDLATRCEEIDAGFGCRAIAEASSAVVEFNSWRQGQGNPGREEAAPYIAGGAVIAAALIGPPVVSGIRARRRRAAIRPASGRVPAVAE